jgi:tetratricopeptide (TPR) repeat protein
MVGIVKKLQDKADANAKYAWMVDRLREGNDVLRARYIVGLITEPPLALYKDSELLNHEQKHKEAVARLEEIEKMNIPQWTLTAQERKAWVYKDCLANYEAAIKIYRQINRPPGTLWSIQECFIRWGKLDDAITTLSEIENSFPEEAAKAAWQKAHYFHQASQGKKAIAQARKILKAYKTSPEASKAHQLLEGYGVATGGGVFEEE